MNTSKAFKACIALSFLLTFTNVVAFSQTDVTAKLKSIPKADGTYLLYQENGIQFFAVKSDGKIMEILVKDKQNNIIPESDAGSGSRMPSPVIPGPTTTTTTAPPPTTATCPDRDHTVCRWVSKLNRCMCIYTGPLN